MVTDAVRLQPYLRYPKSYIAGFTDRTAVATCRPRRRNLKDNARVPKVLKNQKNRCRATNLMSLADKRENIEDETDMEAMAQDAIVWASQHGLVSYLTG